MMPLCSAWKTTGDQKPSRQFWNQSNQGHKSQVCVWFSVFKFLLLRYISAERLYIFLVLHWALHKQSPNCTAESRSQFQSPRGSLVCRSLCDECLHPLLPHFAGPRSDSRTHTNTNAYTPSFSVAYATPWWLQIALLPLFLSSKSKVIWKFLILF